MATLQDLADWIASAPDGARIEWDAPQSTDESRELAERTLEQIQAGLLL